MAHRTDHQKTLAAFDEFTPIKANLLGCCRAIFNTLRVDNSHRRQGVLVYFQAIFHRQLIGNQKPRVVFGPFSKVPPGGRSHKPSAKAESLQASRAK